MAGEEKICGEHHVPRSRCPRGAGHTRTVRFPDETWDDAGASAASASAFIVPAAEAFLGFVRCRRCDAPVALRNGDLTGMTMPDAYRLAYRQVRHPDHEPVWFGAKAALPAAADDLAGQMASLAGTLGRVQARIGRTGRTGSAKDRQDGPAPLRLRCGRPVGRGLCGRPKGHAGYHQSEGSYQKAKDRSVRRAREKRQGSPAPAAGNEASSVEGEEQEMTAAPLAVPFREPAVKP